MHGQRLFAWTLPLEFQTRPVSIYLVTLSMVTYYYSGKALEMNVLTMQGVRMEQWNTAAQDFQNLILLFRLD